MFFVVYGHKDTIFFVITKIVIYLCRKNEYYYCVRTQLGKRIGYLHKNFIFVFPLGML